ncbi:hypothetical protein SAY86_003048 [Trapa natans]|uniref:Uncharacterized protein n=1 Tax=Trapa natans TaxID=22666 RepID=A0AAN7LL82_TRANT|nr:hypothetical protein SAY86_003048 [Trapa natans]
MNRKFGGSRAPTGTPSLAWSCVVVVVSLLAGASVVHNIYKPNLVRRFHCFLSLMDPARKVFDEISSKLCRQLQVLMETRRKSSAENDHGDGVTSKQLPVARTLHCVNILNSTWLDLLPNLKVGLELDHKATVAELQETLSRQKNLNGLNLTKEVHGTPDIVYMAHDCSKQT